MKEGLKIRERGKEQGNDLWFNSPESQLTSIIQTSEEQVKQLHFTGRPRQTGLKKNRH